MSSIAAGTATKSSEAAASTGHVGTLLWIGPRRHPEMSDAYRSCESLVPQLAYRASLEDACRRPAQFVASVVFARTKRSHIAPRHLEHLRQTYPDAKFVCLLSSGCEGEVRTGDPWPGCQRIYWHRWNQETTDWLLNDRAIPGHDTSPPLFLAIVAGSFQQAEPLLEVASQNRWPATWVTPGKSGLVRSVTHVLWDDSAAGPAGRRTWSQRLGLFACQGSPPPEAPTPLHGWFAGFPRLHDWREARAAGVDCLLSKPASLSALIRFVSARGHR